VEAGIVDRLRDRHHTSRTHHRLDLTGVAIDGANRNDVKLPGPMNDDVDRNTLGRNFETVHVDRGYDYPRVRSQPDDAGLTARSITAKLIDRRNRRSRGLRPIRRRLANLYLALILSLGAFPTLGPAIE